MNLGAARKALERALAIMSINETENAVPLRGHSGKCHGFLRPNVTWERSGEPAS